MNGAIKSAPITVVSKNGAVATATLIMAMSFVFCATNPFALVIWVPTPFKVELILLAPGIFSMIRSLIDLLSVDDALHAT